MSGERPFIVWNLEGDSAGERPDDGRDAADACDEAERSHLVHLAQAADDTSAILRTEAGRDPQDGLMHELVGELCTRSEEFRTLWSRHDVRLHGSGTKHFHHLAVGDLDLAYESLELVSGSGLTLTVYAAEPAPPTADALSLLSSWWASVSVGAERGTIRGV